MGTCEATEARRVMEPAPTVTRGRVRGVEAERSGPGSTAEVGSTP